MRFNDAVAVMLKCPEAIMVQNNGRSDRDVQYCFVNGAFSWTCANTVGGTVPHDQFEKLKQKNEEGWEVYRNLYTHTPLR